MTRESPHLVLLEQASTGKGCPHKSYIVNIGMIECIESLGDSYEISFYGYDKKAYMSKGKYIFIKDKLSV